MKEVLEDMLSKESRELVAVVGERLSHHFFADTW
jgi:hypothetical protein